MSKPKREPRPLPQWGPGREPERFAVQERTQAAIEDFIFLMSTGENMVMALQRLGVSASTMERRLRRANLQVPEELNLLTYDGRAKNVCADCGEGCTSGRKRCRPCSLLKQRIERMEKKLCRH